MRKSINLFCLAVLIFGIGLCIYLFRAPATEAAFTGMPLNQPQRIDFRIDKHLWDQKTPREKLDQARDWLLYTTVSQSGRSTKELSDIFFDLPASRQEYLKHVANFEYEETRSRFIGNGEVVALIPANSGNRIDQLAHIADEQRKNTGQKPKSVLVFEYELTLDAQKGRPGGTITRRDTIDGRDLYTEQYGYFETTIKSPADLKTFLSRIDDIVFAQDDGGGLLVGGRKLQGSQYRGIGVEDIAAIWQSENEIQAKKNEFDKKWKDKVEGFNKSWSGQTYRTPMERIRLEAARDKEWSELHAQHDAEMKGLHLVAGSGFSLDPSYHFDDLKKSFRQFIVPFVEYSSSGGYSQPSYSPLYRNFLFPLSRSEGPHVTTASEVEAGLDRCDIEPFFDWLESKRASAGKEVEIIESLFEVDDTPEDRAAFQILKLPLDGFIVDQQARYDGSLQNTEVGMILFYTDLVAKLWGFDYKGSAPRGIEDFRSQLDILQHTSPAFLSKSHGTRYSRLWFGPDTRGYQSVEKGETLVFARRATRLFAKSAGNISQRNEVEPDPAMAKFINWWDDHFEEVGRYEPQYQRLNEIMKWSLVITWLNQAGRGADLGFLNAASVPVNRTHRFPDWIQQQPDLRFSQSSDIKFLTKPNRCTTTEILPRLSSEHFTQSGDKTDSEHKRVIQGGVSLSEEAIFAERTLLSAESKVSNLAVRSSLDYAPLKSGENILHAMEGSSYKFQNLAKEQVLITSTPKDGSILRTAYGDLAPDSFEHLLASQENALTIQSKYGKTGIGSLTIERSPNAFSVGWQSREFDLGQSLARDLSRAAEPSKVLSSESMVESAIKLEKDQGYLVRLRNSDEWIRLRPEKEASAGLSPGWQARFADVESSSKPFEVAWWKQAEVSSQFGDDGYVLMRTSANEKSSLIEATHEIPKSAEKITILADDQKVAALIDRKTGSIWIRYSDLPESLRANPGLLQKTLSAGNLAKPGFAADGVLQLRLSRDPLHEILAGGNYEKAAQELARSPEGFARSLDQYFKNALTEADEALAAKDYEGLVNNLDDLIDLYGSRPELTLRKGVALINSGNVDEAAQALNQSFKLGADRTALFDELNSRLASAPFSSEGKVQLSVHGELMATQLQVSALPTGTKINLESVDLDSSFFYIQDNPGFNLESSPGVRKTISELVSGEFEIIKLPKGDLSKYRPIEIYTGESRQTFRVVNESATSYHLRVPATAGLHSKCNNGQSPPEGCGDVYLIVPRKT